MMIEAQDSLRERWRCLPRLLRLLWELGPREVQLIVLFSVANGLVPVVALATLRRLVDSAAGVVTGTVVLSQALIWLAALLLVDFVQELFGLTYRWLGSSIQERLKARAQERLLLKASRLPLDAFEQPAFFDQLHRAQQGLDTRLFTTMEHLFAVPSDLVTVVSLLLYVGSGHVLFPVILLLGLLPHHVVSLRFGRERYRLQRKHAGAERKMEYLSRLMIGREAAAEVRLFGLQDHLLDLRQGLFRRLRDDRLELVRAEYRRTMNAVLAQQLTYGLVITGVVALVARGRLSVGFYAAYLGAAERFRGALLMLLFAAQNIDTDLRYVRDLLDYLELDEEPLGIQASSDERPTTNDQRRTTHEERPGDAESPVRRWSFVVRRPDTQHPNTSTPQHPPIPVPVVRFEAVTFTYPGSERPVLEQITFTLSAGERIALVGENGAGKSTLAKLLLGLYPPTSGRITVDGVDLREIPPAEWRARAAAVFQDYVRYEVTVRENIGFGDLRRLDDLAAIQSAAVKSGADAVAAALPAGYETLLGKAYDEAGQDLSIGQWQKLAIARAYLRDAQVLVLDEPTAALDARAEVEVYRQFRDMSQGKSVLFISHRLGSARLADRILVLEAGRIVEEGTHADLVEQKGRYARMYAIQAGWYL